jgi:hypothetical protein
LCSGESLSLVSQAAPALLLPLLRRASAIKPATLLAPALLRGSALYAALVVSSAGLLLPPRQMLLLRPLTSDSAYTRHTSLAASSSSS